MRRRSRPTTASDLRHPTRSASLSPVEAPAVVKTAPARATELGERFVDALGYATRVHDGQIRGKDGQPYIAHLLRVSGLVIQDGGSEDEAIAALLHDAAEDQGGLERLDDIRVRYGHTVADIVDECTDSYGDPKPPWRRRKEEYIRSLDGASDGGLLVSLADKLDNVNTVVRGFRIRGEEQWTRTGKSTEDVLWFYGTLAARFSELRPGPLSEELVRAVGELKRLIEGTGQGAGA
jgi:(p)ppGpp synthase/HD superfamily hydrolase